MLQDVGRDHINVDEKYEHHHVTDWIELAFAFAGSGGEDVVNYVSGTVRGAESATRTILQGIKDALQEVFR